MKVKCKDKYYSESITIGEEYILMRESETHYAIINDDGDMVSYDKKYFEPIEQKEKSNKKTIKDWKDLDGFENDRFVLRWRNCVIALILKGKNRIIDFDTGYLRPCHFEDFDSRDTVLAWLKLFGFDVEFEKEMTITQNDYNFIEIYCNNQDEATITKAEKDGYVFIGSLKMPLSWKLFESLEYGKPYFVSDLRKFRVEG